MQDEPAFTLQGQYVRVGKQRHIKSPRCKSWAFDMSLYPRFMVLAWASLSAMVLVSGLEMVLGGAASLRV